MAATGAGAGAGARAPTAPAEAGAGAGTAGVAAGPGGAGLERIGDVGLRQRQLHGLGEKAGAGQARAILLLTPVLAEQRPGRRDEVTGEEGDGAAIRFEPGCVVEPRRLPVVADAHVVTSFAAAFHEAVARSQSQAFEIIVRVSAVVGTGLAGCGRVGIRSGVIDAGVAPEGRIGARGVLHTRLRVGRIPGKERALRALPLAGVRRSVRRGGRGGRGGGGGDERQPCPEGGRERVQGAAGHDVPASA